MNANMSKPVDIGLSEIFSIIWCRHRKPKKRVSDSVLLMCILTEVLHLVLLRIAA